jgi:hypothetical protein
VRIQGRIKSGEEYEEKKVDLAGGEQRTEAYLKINPLGRVPALLLDNDAATTARPSTGSNPKKSGLHSVGIGALRESTMNCCGTTVFVDSQPRCTQ